MKATTAVETTTAVEAAAMTSTAMTSTTMTSTTSGRGPRRRKGRSAYGCRCNDRQRKFA